jgi:hypothetical protein
MENMMDEYRPNSNKFKEGQTGPAPGKKIEKVIAGEARVKTKNEIQKFAETFISEDVGNVKSYILLDVLVPAVKKAIWDIITNGVDMLLYGASGGFKRNSPASKIAYKNYYEKEGNWRDYNAPRARIGYSYDDVVLDNRGEAEDVLSRMDEIVSTYGLVSVADLYDLVGVTGNYTDNKYGWTDIRNASVIRVKDGYLIKLPKPLPLN